MLPLIGLAVAGVAAVGAVIGRSSKKKRIQAEKEEEKEKREERQKQERARIARARRQSLENFQNIMQKEYEAEVSVDGWKSAKLDRMDREIEVEREMLSAKEARLKALAERLSSRVEEAVA